TKLCGFHGFDLRASCCTGLKMQYRVALIGSCTGLNAFTRRIYKDVKSLHFLGISRLSVLNQYGYQLLTDDIAQNLCSQVL
ncbi:MAG: hypothetical protein ACKPB7_38170, partial [Sphaerospermopsis kisseleviana]